MKHITYIVLGFMFFLQTAHAQNGGSWIWEEDEWIWVDEDSDDIATYIEEESFEGENLGLDSWSVYDSLKAQYRARQFREDWRENYNSALFDYTEIQSQEKEQAYNWDLSGFFNVLAFLAKLIGYALIVLVIYLVVRAIFTDSGITIQGFRRKKSEVRDVQDTEITMDEDWLKRAQDAKKSGDLKLAVRYYFLAYLKQLHEEEQIDFHKDKSNREYKYEISDFGKRNEFNVLSRVFDYCWYGEFEIDAEQFSRVEILFSNHLKV
jgi:hypothetical protein